jgi:hypothetical protein
MVWLAGPDLAVKRWWAKVFAPLLSRPLDGTGIGAHGSVVRTMALNGLFGQHLGSPVFSGGRRRRRREEGGGEQTRVWGRRCWSKSTEGGGERTTPSILKYIMF